MTNKEKLDLIRSARSSYFPNFPLIKVKELLSINNWNIEETIEYCCLLKLDYGLVHKCITYSKDGLAIIHRYSEWFSRLIREDKTALQAIKTIRDEDPDFFETYVKLLNL